MPTILLTEYCTVAGVPFATPAHMAEDLSELHAPCPMRVTTKDLPYIDGEFPRAEFYAPKPVGIPVLIRGGADADGQPHPSTLEGLRTNLDELVAASASSWRNNPKVRLYLADGTTRAAPISDINVGLGWRSQNDWSAEVTFVIHGGVMRADDAVLATLEQGTGTREMTVPNPGTAQQYEMVIELTGNASSVRLTNLTYGPGGNVWLDFGGQLATGVTIDTKAGTAVRDGIEVGLITHRGHPRLLPLKQDTDNTIEVAAEGGHVEVSISHYPAYR